MTHLPDLKNENPWPDGGGVDWEHVWPQHRRWLATVLLSRGVEAGAVEEVLQEVGAAAVAGAGKLRDARKVAPWLYRIAVLKALQYRRRQGRRRKLIDRYAMSRGDALDRTEPEPLDWLLAEEQKQLVRQALATLSPRDAEIMLLKYTEGWSYRQLAEHLGVSVSAVEARLHRARERMRQALARLAPELAKR
jgi:RNA polymerase sigma factor (sigma-70 family)